MRLLCLFLVAFCLQKAASQCNGTASVITSDYTFDAKYLAAQEMSQLGHPEENNPFVPQAILMKTYGY